MSLCCFLAVSCPLNVILATTQRHDSDMTLFLSYDKFQTPYNLASGWQLCVWARCETTRRFEVLNL